MSSTTVLMEFETSTMVDNSHKSSQCQLGPCSFLPKQSTPTESGVDDWTTWLLE